MLRFRGLFFTIILLFAAACSRKPAEDQTPTLPATAAPSVTSIPGPEITSSPPVSITLRLWLPPEFDPESGTPAGYLLKSRLEEFSTRRTGVKVEVRIKAKEGAGGLLDSLTAANAAAPLAIPDLVALSRSDLELAAIKGLLHPFDRLTVPSDDASWYNYARQLGQVQNTPFGIPFAGDALLMLYRPQVVSVPPTDWQTSLTINGPLAFAAADPKSLFTLALYQAAGGPIQDDQGRPFLDPAVLAQVLAYYQEAEKAELMPFWLTQLETQEQVWAAYEENRATLVITWASLYLKDNPADSAAATIPTPDGVPFTLADGWVWALASNQTERKELGVQLAEFLTETDFLSKWSLAAGYLPPRSTAFSAWPDDSRRAVAIQIAESASLYPPEDVLFSLGSPLQKASVEILKEQAEPLAAAQAAAGSLGNP